MCLGYGPDWTPGLSDLEPQLFTSICAAPRASCLRFAEDRESASARASSVWHPSRPRSVALHAMALWPVGPPDLRVSCIKSVV